MNSEGISVASLSFEDKRAIDGGKSDDYICHALSSVDYLKIDKRNFINFDFSGEKKTIQIFHQYKSINVKTGSLETKFEELYRI